MITVSEIDFSGIVGSDITDTNGQTVTKNTVGTNTIDKDGSGNGVFFVNSAEGAPTFSLDMISEPVTSDTDFLDKDFEITFTDAQYFCSGVIWVIIPFAFGSVFSTGSGYALQSLLAEGTFWLYKITGGVGGDKNVYTYPSGFDFLANHTYKIKRESGAISFLIDNVACTKTASALDGQTWDSYAGTGQICFGNVYDVGRDLTLTVGDFKIDLESSPAPSSPGGAMFKKHYFQRGVA